MSINKIPGRWIVSSAFALELVRRPGYSGRGRGSWETNRALAWGSSHKLQA